MSRGGLAGARASGEESGTKQANGDFDFHGVLVATFYVWRSYNYYKMLVGSKNFFGVRKSQAASRFDTPGTSSVAAVYLSRRSETKEDDRRISRPASDALALQPLHRAE
jgi:hypothetical protein